MFHFHIYLWFLALIALSNSPKNLRLTIAMSKEAKTTILYNAFQI